MAVSGRFPLLLLLGVVAVVLQPTREMVLLWVGICVGVTLVDLAIAVSPRRLDIQREPVGQVRLGADGSTSLLITNTSGRWPAPTTSRRVSRRFVQSPSPPRWRGTSSTSRGRPGRRRRSRSA